MLYIFVSVQRGVINVVHLLCEYTDAVRLERIRATQCLIVQEHGQKTANDLMAVQVGETILCV